MPDDDSYDLACLYMANRMLPILRSRPEIGLGKCYGEAIRQGMKSVEPSGFMVGWAFNAARAILGLEETSNPAIIDIATSEP